MRPRTRERAVSYDAGSQLLVAGLIGVALGLAVLWAPLSWVLGLTALGALAMAALVRADVVLMAVVIATSTIVPEGLLPSVDTPMGTFFAPDVILLALFAALAVRWLLQADHTMVRTPLDVPLLAFYGVALLGIAAAVARSDVALIAGLREARVVTYYLTFFAVTQLVRRDAHRRALLGGLMFAATVVAAAMLAQYAVGPSVALLPGRVETLFTEGAQHTGVTRILPPGQSLILVGLVLQSVALAQRRLSLGGLVGYARWGVLALAVLLTFNRSYWVAAAVSLLLLVALLASEERHRLVVWGLVTLAVVVVLVLALAGQPGSRGERLMAASLDRIGSLGRAETFWMPGSSFGWRGVEYEHALPQIATRPILGLGLGSEYRPWDARLDSDTFDGRYYLHNAHLWIVLKTGWLGYACLLWFSFLFLSRALRLWRGVDDPTGRSTVLGVGALYAGILVAALVNPILMQWAWTPVLGILMGCSEAFVADEAARERALERR